MIAATPGPSAPAGEGVERERALKSAVDAWDAARCRLNEQWHGGWCEPASEAAKANAAPMILAAVEAYTAALRPAPDAAGAGLAEVERENAILRAALSALPSIAEECRVKWDAGMKAGKLLIALTDPTLRYRADITELHRVAAIPTKREIALTADLAAARRERDDAGAEAERLRKLVNVPADLRSLSDKVDGSAWSPFESAVRDGFGFDLVEASSGHRNDDEDGDDLASLICGAVNRLRAQIAAAPSPSDDGRGPAAGAGSDGRA